MAQVEGSASAGSRPASGSSEAGTADLRTARIAASVREILRALGDDPDRPELAQTPQRVADAFTEFFVGLHRDPLEALSGPGGILPEPAVGELIVMEGIEFRSLCEHHLLPFLGRVHIAYRPRQAAAGLSRLTRLVEILAARPQIQERLTEQIAQTLEQGLDPEGVVVMVEARHSCVWAREARQAETRIVTLASRGSFTDAAERREALDLIRAHRGIMPAEEYDGDGVDAGARAAVADRENRERRR